MKRLAHLLILLALPAAGQEPEETVLEPAKEIRHKVSLRGGSLLVGRLDPAQWRVTTSFGPLTIPVDEIKRIRFGRKADLERFEEVKRIIQYLADADPDRRDYAQARLREIGVFAAPELKHAVKAADDPEVKRRAAEILQSIEVPEEEWPQDDDQIETKSFSIVGAVGEDTLKISVAELGLVTLKRKDVIEVRAYRPGTTHKVAVLGSHNMGGTWLETGIQVKKRANLRIVAEGQIHWPNWNNQITRPEGGWNMGSMNLPNLGNIAYGCLIGRVGNNGAMFKVGSQFTGTVEGNGELQLSIVGNFRNQPHNGEYEVRINVDDAGWPFSDD